TVYPDARVLAATAARRYRLLILILIAPGSRLWPTPPPASRHEPALPQRPRPLTETSRPAQPPFPGFLSSHVQSDGDRARLARERPPARPQTERRRGPGTATRNPHHRPHKELPLQYQ